MDGKVWKWSEPFDINTVGSVVRVMKTFNQQQSLIITIKQITNVQKQVAMKLKQHDRWLNFEIKIFSQHQ